MSTRQNRKLLIVAGVAAVLAGLYTRPVQGANIVVTNVTLKSCMYAGKVAYVKFDVSWDASWRSSWTETTPSVTVTNWDAAWIFVKYRCRDGANTNWNHATLSTNNSDHVAPTTNCTINVGLSTNGGGANFGAGVFLYRSAEGSGSWTNTGVKLRWRYGDDGVASTSRVDVYVHAIEMVYVPEGSFYVGDGSVTTPQGRFENGNSGSPLQITSETSLTTLGGGAPGSLGNTNTTGMAAGWADDFSNNNSNVQTLPGAFPKGYNAFYCMKYEISQGQYAVFLNQLTNQTQATARDPGGSSTYRYSISGSWPNYSGSAPTRACNYLSWADGAAYADWVGLRPITELEYEKACRGPLNAVADEYAWGTATVIADVDKAINVYSPSGLEDGTETNATDVSLGAAVYGNNQIGLAGVNAGTGPVRCGLFATANSTRITSGASYWGIMEMSGNLWERPVTVGNSTGRLFTGTHGNGKLTSGGDADVPTWPDTTGSGAGFRGGYWLNTSIYLRASDRGDAADTYSLRYVHLGWRAGRSAPVVNP